MAAFTTGQPVVTDTPNVQVDAAAGLAPGKIVSNTWTLLI